MDTGDDITGPVNLGNPVEVSVRTLAERVISLTGSSSQIVHHPLPTDDPKQRCPDITRAREILKWNPTVPLDLGLEKTIAHFKHHFCPGHYLDLPASFKSSPSSNGTKVQQMTKPRS
jgi:UDP-glucuronate decarboxylase